MNAPQAMFSTAVRTCGGMNWLKLSETTNRIVAGTGSRVNQAAQRGAK